MKKTVFDKKGSMCLVSCAALVMSVACACAPEVAGLLDGDWLPPQLVGISGSGPRLIELEFDEDITAPDPASLAGFSVMEGATPVVVDSVEAHAGVVAIRLAADMVPGEPYVVSGKAADASGNTVGFDLRVRGYNGRVPLLLVNELVTEKGTKHKDFIEFRAGSDGNVGGVAVYVGSAGSFDTMYVFPQAEVVAGEYLVLHMKPDGGEADEIVRGTDSPGIDATSMGRDFWYAPPVEIEDPAASLQPGIPDSTGVISVYTGVGGTLADAILYASGESATYDGFGRKKTQDAAKEIVAAGGWCATGTGAVTDACCVIALDATSTRSVSRSSSGADTNAASDWHISPTSGLTPGALNGDDAYVPL